MNRDIVSQKDTLMRRQTSFAGLLLVLLLLLLAPGMHAAAHRPCCGEITSAGDQLASVLDGMNVEALWIANQHVNWETGEPDRGAAYEGPGKQTHCSAFAAAAAKQLGVYLLRPPDTDNYCLPMRKPNGSQAPKQ